MASSFQIATQEKRNWCWAAVAATISSYFFPNSTMQQCQIAKSVTGIADCCNGSETCDRFAKLETALASINPKLTIQTMGDKIPFEDLKKQIDASLPVCARIQWAGETDGHFVIISGYSISDSNEPWIDISDPYYEDSTVPYQQFVSAYLNAGKWSDTYLVSQP